MNDPQPSILLIDDNAANLESLLDRLREILAKEPVKLMSWVPKETDGSPADAFKERVDANTALVVTDYDLTTSIKGLFGLAIVGWCQSRSIPVGDFSRGNVAALPKEPNLFELRVPSDDANGAAFVATTFRGFRDIRNGIEQHRQLLTERRSLAAVLASLLRRVGSESQFAAYMSRLGASNSALLQNLKDFAVDERPDDENKIRLLTYVLGHVLLNAILKYPGPILSRDALSAYLATTTTEIDNIVGLFETARYTGPFSDGVLYFWREDLDAILDEKGANVAADQFESFGDYNRQVVEVMLGRRLAPHNCSRCGGWKGGFWCPFTNRPVCERADCSVPASSWIPFGAQLSRVERDFYDEWAPLLGL